MTRADGRLSQEGRLLRTLIGIVVLFSALVVGPRAFAAGDSADTGSRTYVVAEGETLWGIANEVAPDAATGQTVARIMSLNHFSSPTIHPGEQILVPVAP